MQTPQSTHPESDADENLSALAWVHGELRRTLDNAHKALRRHVKEVAALGSSDVDAVDPAVLRTARVHLHQGVGALELIGLPVVAQALRASEAAIQRLSTRPKLATSAAAETVERLSFAVLDFMARALAGKSVAPLALFPQYAAVQALAGAARVHPADLWAHDWQWRALAADPDAAAHAADESARTEMEALALALMRQAEPVTQRRMSDLCAELAAGSAGELATLWQLAAAFFEGQAAGLIAPDVHTKRIASRLLAVLREAQRGQAEAPDRLAQDLLFFCVRAEPAPASIATPRLAAVQVVWPGDSAARADYATPRLGLVDPAHLLQARRRVAGAKEAWSAVAGGELHRASAVGESFALLADTLQKLFPGGDALAKALQAAAARTAQADAPPEAALAMEVATSLLYLDAVLEDGELDQPVLGDRVRRLAQRVEDLAGGGAPQSLEQWMEELYRRISDRQTMGSVVQELRASLSEVEKQIDQYFREPSRRELLIPVPAQLSSMRSVLSVLGLDQASQAVLHMRDDVDMLAQTEVDPRRAVQTGTFDRLADNLGALSFLIDMLSVQPQMAKTLFRFDPASGSLSAVMGQSERESAFAAFEPAAEVTAAGEAPAPAEPPTPAVPPPAPVTDTGLEDDAEMREIFLEEAREVLASARAALAHLAQASEDMAELTALRRAFHTLKGSARMVGLKAFGDAAWSGEQLFNARLAEQARMDPPLQAFTAEALAYLGDWVEAIADGVDRGHAAAAVAAAADALREDGRALPIGSPSAPAAEEAAPEEAASEETAAEETVSGPDLSMLHSLVPDLPSAEDLDLAPFEQTLTFPVDAPTALPEAPAEGLHFELRFDGPDAADAPAEPGPDVAELSFEEAGLSFPPASFDPTGPEPETMLEPEAQALPEPEPDLPSEPAVATMPDAEGEEPVKLVGPLRIPIPLFNIFLNEADEQSRRLGTALAEWALEDHEPVGETPIALAHSLAGNSATVGFGDLSALSRALEHALTRSQAIGRGSEGEPVLFSAAADEIRRLLHQFAAGFLKPVDPGLMQRLADHELALSPHARDTESGVLGAAVDDAQAEPAPPSPAATPSDADADEPIEVDDAIDADLFPIFEEEADELLPQLRGRLSNWVRHPSDADSPAACLRTLHTFKGGARLAGALRVGEMAHRLETGIERLAGQEEVPAVAVERLLARADALATAFEQLRKPMPLAAVAAAVVVPPAADLPPAEPVEPAAGTAADDTTPRPSIDWDRFAVDSPVDSEAPVAEPAATGGAGTVRVRAGLLDRLVNEAGEVSITRARIESDMRSMQSSLEDLTENLDRLRRQLRDIELQAETQITSRMDAAKASSQAFDPLEMDRFTRFQELTRMMAESVNDVATVQRGLQRALQSSEDELAAQARLTRNLQDDLLRTRMVEFESLSDRLQRVVRQAAQETGKPVRLALVGGGIEVDRGVLERMVGPFEHLLRNSVAHGIEPAAQRREAGKAETGTVTMTIVQEGNEVAVELRDDGAGLDLARIRRRAVERGLLGADATASDEDLAQLIFVPGFSTAEAVTGLAGRGVGMDVVRAEVTAMGGRIETRSEAGQGTTFRMLLPLTTAVTQVVMLRFGERRIAVPSTLVEVVRRAKPAEIEQSYARGAFLHAGTELPFFWLGALLQADGQDLSTERSQMVVIVRSAAQRVAVHVDEVLGNQEVVVKNLGPQLSHLPGLAGITLLPSGAVVTIYNPVALAHVYGDDARRRMQPQPQALPDEPAAPVALAPLVLVVDDSLTVRRVTQRLLLREGYRVALAKDGLDAIEKLAAERPAVLLSDIEMPRMDGFDLVRNVRADARLEGLPVIMITSRIAQKHRDYAADLGVEHYLGKPYAEDELLALVARHAGADIAL